MILTPIFVLLVLTVFLSFSSGVIPKILEGIGNYLEKRHQERVLALEVRRLKADAKMAQIEERKRDGLPSWVDRENPAEIRAYLAAQKEMDEI